MFKGLLVFVVVLAALLGALYAVVYQPQQDALATAEQEAQVKAQEATAAAREADALRAQVGDLEVLLEGLRQTSAELEAQVAAREAELAALRSTHDELVGELQEEIAQGQVQVERLRGKLRVDVVDQILFDSGQAELKPEGRVLLGKVAGVLERANRRIEVQGHTDNVPIKGALAKRFPTNWELSAARAVNVVRFLQGESSLDPALLAATGMSEYQPKSSNDSDAGRRQNRRIEILLAPLEKLAEAEKPAEAE